MRHRWRDSCDVAVHGRAGFVRDGAGAQASAALQHLPAQFAHSRPRTPVSEPPHTTTRFTATTLPPPPILTTRHAESNWLLRASGKSAAREEHLGNPPPTCLWSWTRPSWASSVRRHLRKSTEVEGEYSQHTGPFTQEVSQILRLANPGSDAIAFKVKTTAPKQYSSHLPCGLRKSDF